MLKNDMYMIGIGQAVLELSSFKVESGNHHRGISLLQKGPVKLIQLVKIAHSFLQSVSKSVPLYHFKLAYVVPHMAVKEFFGSHF